MTEPTSEAGNRRRWWGLVVIALAYLLITLDATIVNVALPTVQQDLDISAAGRHWVITAYTLAFAGLVVLGGRASDYIGHKRAFLIALAGLAVASIVGGAAVNPAMLLTARAGQGVFAALLGPTALSLLSNTFSDPDERGKAFAVFGAVLGASGGVGLVLGGLLTEYLSWHWVLFINVPIALIAAFGGVLTLTENRNRQRGRFDVLGAVLVTAGLVLLVYGFSEAANRGWAAPLTLLPICGGAVLLGLFLVTQKSVSNPLIPLRILANRGRGGAYLAVLLAMVGLFGMFLFVSFYLQTVRGYSPLATGFAFLPQAVGTFVAAPLASRLVMRVPPRRLLVVGLLLGAAGMAWLTGLNVDSGYALHVLPSLVVIGVGLGMAFPVAANLATFGVAESEAGVASATLNTSQQMGASLGTALLNTIAASSTAAYLAEHAGEPGARLSGLVQGYTQATAWGAGVLALAAVIVFGLVNVRLDNARTPDADAADSAGVVGADPDTSDDGGKIR